MNRKVIRLATNTLVVSLPSKWAQRHGVKKGDEVEIEEIGQSLKILARSEATEGSMTVKIKGAERFLRRLIDTPYRMGYDEVRIEYDDPAIYHKVQSEINNLMGFEIIRQGEGYCVARNIARGIEAEFGASLNRLFLVTLQFLEDFLSAIQKGQEGSFSGVMLTEDITNRLSHFCKRMLNLERTPDPVRSRSVYRIVCLLEEIGDLLKKACQYVVEERLILGKETKEYLEKVIEQFRFAYKLHQRYDPVVMEEYARCEKRNEKKGVELARTPSKETYIQILFSMVVEDLKHLSEELSV